MRDGDRDQDLVAEIVEVRVTAAAAVVKRVCVQTIVRHPSFHLVDLNLLETLRVIALLGRAERSTEFRSVMVIAHFLPMLKKVVIFST